MRTAAKLSRRPSEPGNAYDHHDLMSLPWRPLMLPLNALRQADRKARTHSKGQIRRIADSILHLGFHQSGCGRSPPADRRRPWSF